MRSKFKIRHIITAAVNAAAVIGVLVMTAVGSSMAKAQNYNYASDRWRSDSKDSFSQVSCYLTKDANFTKNNVTNIYYTLMSKLKEASVEPEEGKKLLPYAYSTYAGKSRVSCDVIGIAEADITAVGGDFFLFRDFSFISGAYFEDDDNSHYGAVIDRMLAWKLYGSENIEGKNIYINNVKLYIAGVIETPGTKAEKRCIGDTPQMFISYDAAEAIFGGAKMDDDFGKSRGYDEVTCFECITPEPVENFAYNNIKENLKNTVYKGGFDIVDNRARFTSKTRVKALKKLDKYIVRDDNIVYPFWENASRIVEVKLSLIYGARRLLLLIPFITLAVLAVKGFRLYKRKEKGLKKAIADGVSVKLSKLRGKFGRKAVQAAKKKAEVKSRGKQKKVFIKKLKRGNIMKKTFATRITALSAALAVIAGSAASCGSNKSETKDQSKTSQQLMAASYRAELVDTDVELKNVSDMKKLDDGRIFIAEYDDEKNAPSYFIADAELTTFDEIKVDLGVELDDDTAVNSELAPDGNIKTLVTFTDFGDAEKPNLDDPDFDPEKFDFEEYYSNAKRTYKLYTVDLSGKVVSETEIKGLEKFEDDEEMGDMGGINEFYPCANGKIIISKYGSMGQQFIAINEDGTAGDEITVSGMSFIESMSPMDDGTIAVSGYSTTGSATKFIDGETFKETGSELKLSDIGNNGAGTLFPGNDTYKYFASSSSGVFGISEDGKSTELLNWLDSDMGDGYVSSFIPLENDDFIVWYDSYTESGDESGLYRLTKRDASELENTKVITVGVLYDNWEVKEKISAFNKAHDGVRFKMTDYSKFDEYDENGMVLSSGESELKKDIVSGKAPDMIVSYNRGIVESLNSKGLFIDLYDYINNDPDIKKDDILPNVLKALEKDGKLPCIAPTFYIDTLAAKGSRVNKPNWTVDDMLAEYDKLSEGSQLTQFDCKEMILMMVLSSLSDAIDYSNGTCNFDTPDFRKLIEFCDKFPAQKDIVDFEDQAAMMEFQKSMQDKSIKNNTILCSDITLDNFEDYTRQLRGDFENDMVFVGYPSSDGRGSLIDFNNNFAILTNSENKDECWELIKEFFKYPADDEDEGYMYGFPILKSEFDKLAEKSTKVPTYKDENGKEVEDPIMFYTDDGKEIKVDPLTNEEKDKIVEFITSVEKPGASIDPDVEMILQEEIMAFLGGEKTADEVINLIQSRVSTLVSEQS